MRGTMRRALQKDISIPVSFREPAFPVFYRRCSGATAAAIFVSVEFGVFLACLDVLHCSGNSHDLHSVNKYLGSGCFLGVSPCRRRLHFSGPPSCLQRSLVRTACHCRGCILEHPVSQHSVCAATFRACGVSFLTQVGHKC